MAGMFDYDEWIEQIEKNLRDAQSSAELQDLKQQVIDLRSRLAKSTDEPNRDRITRFDNILTKMLSSIMDKLKRPRNSWPKS